MEHNAALKALWLLVIISLTSAAHVMEKELSRSYILEHEKFLSNENFQEETDSLDAYENQLIESLKLIKKTPTDSDSSLVQKQDLLNDVVQLKQYDPNWESLDKRPLPSWYDEAKFGIFIHWGVFSVPSFRSEWFWNFWKIRKHQDVIDFMKKNYPPGFSYPEFAKDFTAEFFNPDEWANLFSDSGAQYVVLTTKHHEGFTLWPSSNSWNWNAMDVGPHRDLVGELEKSIRSKTNLHFGLYHSLFEWFNPLFRADQASNWTTRNYVDTKAMPELYDIVNTYKPDVVWSDGDPAPVEYWNSTGFLSWLYNESPVKDTVVTNDRWGYGTACKHGGYYTCQDRYNPGKKQNHKWENCMTIDKRSWGYRREAQLQDFLTIEEIISTLASTISCGGNMLMNIGPTKEGMIAPIFQERLKQIGQYLKVNGEAVYKSTPWRAQNDSFTKHIWYTTKPGYTPQVYAFVLQWPSDNILVLGDPLPIGKLSPTVELLGFEGGLLGWNMIDNRLHVYLPVLAPGQLPWSWVLRLTGFE